MSKTLPKTLAQINFGISEIIWAAHFTLLFSKTARAWIWIWDSEFSRARTLICSFWNGLYQKIFKYLNHFNPCGWNDQLIVRFFSLKIVERSFASKNLNWRYFDEKLRFALFVSLRSIIFSETKSAKRSFASNYLEFSFLTRSFASSISFRSAIFSENVKDN